MYTFARLVEIRSHKEAEELCTLIQNNVPNIYFEEVAETFGCTVEGDVIDYVPMVGTWWVHFSFDWDRVGDITTKYVKKINPEIQNVTEIVGEYETAVNYITKHNPAFVKLTELLKVAHPDEEQKMELADSVVAFDREKFFEMDKRRDIALGSLNPYTDYSELEDKLKYL